MSSDLIGGPEDDTLALQDDTLAPQNDERIIPALSCPITKCG
ncbi:MAG: hypothetical protein U9R52_04680 [Candidatus Omnitrophota bacterium]|nr:hypothetical protein [Candidatus Omnitrophota bacterium]